MTTIEELLKQSKFRNEKHKAIISVLYAANLINGSYDEIFQKYDLTIQQYNVLRILRGQHPHPSTINLIRERMLDRMSDASRIVERLRKAGLVERVQSEKDRRAVDVLISKKGLSLLAQIDKMDNQFDRPAELLDENEARQLSLLVGKMINGLI